MVVLQNARLLYLLENLDKIALLEISKAGDTHTTLHSLACLCDVFPQVPESVEMA